MSATTGARRAAGSRSLFGAASRRIAVPERIRGVPAPAIALALAYLVTAAYLVDRATQVTSYIWLIDEGLYVKQAMGFVHGAFPLPHVYGLPRGPSNALYPLLMAPAWALFGAVTAFKAAHALNAIVFASTMFPVYLLARRLRVAWGWAFAAGVMSVWIPWSVATFVVMTEAVAYAACAWALLAIAVAVAHPRPRNDLLALVAIGIAFYARTQFALLGAVFVLAVLVAELAPLPGDVRSWRRKLRDHWPLVAVVALVLLASVAGASLLGDYQSTADKPPFPYGLWNNAVNHLAYLVIGTAILPFVCWVAWTLRSLAQPRDRDERAVALVFLIAVVAMLYLAALFSIHNVASRMQERYVFYVVPCFFVAFVAVLGDRERRAPLVTLLVGGAVAAAVIVSAPLAPNAANGAFAHIANAGAGFHEVLIPKVLSLTGWLPGVLSGVLESFALIAVLMGVLAAVALAGPWRRFAAPVLALAVLVFGVIEVRWLADNTIPGLNVSQVGNANVGPIGGYRRDWIDAALPAGERADLLEGFLPQGDTIEQWRWTEFWNKDIDQLFSQPGRPNAFAFPARPLTVDPSSGRLQADGLGRYLVTPAKDAVLGLKGEIVREAPWGAALMRSDGPWTARWQVRGANADGTSNGRRDMVFDVFESGQKELSFALAPFGEGPTKVPYELLVGGRVVRRGTVRSDEPPRRFRVRVVGGAGALTIRPRTVRKIAATGAPTSLFVKDVEVG